MSLSCQGLKLRLGARQVVNGVTLAFAPGQWTAIVGPNGAGKSTLLALLAGLAAPDAGGVQLHQRALAEWPMRQRAGMLIWLGQDAVPHDAGEIAAIDVVRLARLPRHGLFGEPDAHDEAVVQAAMLETECSAFAHRRLSQLSGGERQRVLIARALATATATANSADAADAADAAAVWLLDEPTTHLDAPHQRALWRSLRARAGRGATVVTVLHDLTLALAADRLIVLNAGRVHGDGAPDDPALHEALTQTFDQAFTLHAVASGIARRWVAVPSD